MSVGSTARAAEEGEADEANVVGGTRVPAGTWRDVVYVVGRESSCTGTLIAPDVVLTAGHCVADQPYEIRSDTVDVSRASGDRIAVKWSRAYPGWESTSYDIGVLMLEHVARGRPRKIAAACTTRERLVDGATVHLVGFGAATPYGDDDNTALREVDLEVTDAHCTIDGACRRSIAPRGEFVAGGGGKDSCFGDSGGPVYLDTPEGPALVGVVSRGAGVPGLPCGGGGVYVRADKVVSWLKTVTRARIDRTADCGPLGPADGDEAEPPAGCTTGSGPPGVAVLLVALGMRRRRTRNANRY